MPKSTTNAQNLMAAARMV